MKLSNLPIEIANFVCLFNEKELLDEFVDRLWPIFKSNKKIDWIKGEDKSYIFHNFSIKEIEGEKFLVGRIIRQMTLKSSQKYEEENAVLKKRSRSLDDSPSTFFLLRLYDHKLIILKETIRAPDLSKIEKIITRALQIHRLEQKKKIEDAFKKKFKRKRLTPEQRDEFQIAFEQYCPRAHFRITPIISYEKAQHVFEGVKSVNSLTVALLHTNQEDPDFRTNLMKQLKESKKVIGKGKTTTIKSSVVDNELGLSVTESQRVVEDVALSEGNASFTVLAISASNGNIKIKDNELTIKDSVKSSEVSTDELKANVATLKLLQHSPEKELSEEEQKVLNQKKLKANQIFTEILNGK